MTPGAHNGDAREPQKFGGSRRCLSSLSTLTRRIPSSSSSRQIVAMMQTTESRRRCNSTIRIGDTLCTTAGWRSLRQCKMCTVVVVVVDVIIHESFQMPSIEDKHVVEQFPAAVGDPALGNAVLPRTPEAGSAGLDAEALYCVDHFVIELRATIKNEIAGGRVEGECFA
jgi:hypothetical protein